MNKERSTAPVTITAIFASNTCNEYFRTKTAKKIDITVGGATINGKLENSPQRIDPIPIHKHIITIVGIDA